MIEFLILILSICSSFDLFFTKVGNLELESALRVEKRNIRFPFFFIRHTRIRSNAGNRSSLGGYRGDEVRVWTLPPS